jgi:2-polyprenyl-6-methoxyphenol hydroxylase-like FAD-dependent oxidoreductase
VSGLDRDFWHWWPGADGKLLALCPLAATDTFQLQAGVAPDTAGELPLAQIQALVDERSGRTDIRVRRVEWQSIWRFNVRMVDRYRAGRVFLAGDSAHVHSPAGGLGMNTGSDRTAFDSSTCSADPTRAQSPSGHAAPRSRTLSRNTSTTA